ncbi:uncharacterized protein isoform X1 [Leptinotarsa decemlineata]|uniref:uncharacterized protein isoform X1 n=1 Tax=Leptinotarsa decemlineata TaxID=7539 RepID=UPI003D306390
MSVNPSKTVLIPFTKRRKLDDLTPLSLNGVVISFETEVKYLGIVLDKRLTWNAHLEKVLHKARLSLWTCRRICGKTWGLGPKPIHWIYVMIVRPMITNGAIAWWPKALQKTAQAKLSGSQRQACLAISGDISTTPSASMEILLDIPPLHIFLERETRWTAYRLVHIANCTNQLNAECNRLLVDIGSHSILEITSDFMRPTVNYELPYKVLFPSREDWILREKEILRADSCWFTDGSKTPSGSGAGVFSRRPRTELSTYLGTYAIVFQAEIYSIELCAERLDKSNLTHKSIKIFSDSQAALEALGSHRATSELVANCQKNSPR